jgi:hypothetical protein
MSLSSSLTRLGRTVALAVLALAGLFFIVFGLLPGIEFLPRGMDLIVGGLCAALAIIWITIRRLGRKRG